MGTNDDVAKEWIQYAENDLEGAKILLTKGEQFYHMAMFHLHQSAEKSIKGMMVVDEIKYPKTHDLDKLLSLIEEKKGSVDSKLYMLISAFEEFSTEVRYPENEILITEFDIKNAMNSSTEILKIAKEKIG